MKTSWSPGAYLAGVLAILVGLFGASWAYTATQRLDFLPDEYGIWLAHSQMIGRCDVGNAVILGSSRATAAFVPKFLGRNIVNLAMTGTTPIETYYQARTIYKCPHPPKFAVLSFSGRDLVETQWFWGHSVHFGILKFDDLQDIARHARELKYPYLYSVSLGSEPVPIMKNWLYAHYFPSYDFAILTYSGFSQAQHNINKQWMFDTLANRGQHAFGHNHRCAAKPAFEAAQSAFSASPLHSYYLDKLIQLLSGHGVKVIFVSPPVSSLTYQGLSASYSRDYDLFLKQVEARHPGFRVVGSTFPTRDVCDFGDSSHLNQAGAEKFSRSVAPLLSAAFSAT